MRVIICLDICAMCIIRECCPCPGLCSKTELCCLCFMFCVLCFVFFVLCFVFHVLCVFCMYMYVAKERGML